MHSPDRILRRVLSLRIMQYNGSASRQPATNQNGTATRALEGRHNAPAVPPLLIIHLKPVVGFSFSSMVIFASHWT